MISLFGSSQLHFIKDHYNVNSIHHDLTHASYTKEIIQAIQFCISGNRMSTDLTQTCFERGIVEGRPICYQPLQKMLNNSDVCIVEISSKICHKFKRYYLNDIAIMPRYTINPKIKNGIITYEQTKEEIEDDILEIRRLLFPKIVIIVSPLTIENLSTDLTNWLEDICSRTNMLLIHPPSQILAKNCSEGKQSIPISTSYKMLIDNLLKEQQKQLTRSLIRQVYYTSAVRVKQHTWHGFGDYIRGCVFLHQESIRLNKQLEIDFSNHPISQFLLCKTQTELKDHAPVQYSYDEIPTVQLIESNIPLLNIFTNARPRQVLEEHHKSFIREHCLTPRLSFTKRITEVLSQLGLQEKQYRVIHTRVGDASLVEKNTCDSNIPNKVIQYYQSLDKSKETIFLSDSSSLLDHLRSKELKTTNFTPTHLGHHGGSSDSAGNTLIEFFLLTKSYEIHQLSGYEWGSGFSYWASQLFNVPCTAKKLFQMEEKK